VTRRLLAKATRQVFMYVSLPPGWGLGARFTLTEIGAKLWVHRLHSCCQPSRVSSKKIYRVIYTCTQTYLRISWICLTVVASYGYCCRDFVIVNERVINLQVNDNSIYVHIMICTYSALGSRASLCSCDVLDFCSGFKGKAIPVTGRGGP
jgi:hypothetical protein